MEYCTHDILQNHVGSWNFPAMLEECQQGYSTVPFLSLFYHSLRQSIPAALCLILLLAVACFVNIKYIADRFFSVSIRNLKHRFQISSIATSCILIPVINGAPDLVCSMAFGAKANGVHTAVGCLVASFIFSILVIVGFIIRSSAKEVIRISKGLYFKELLFYTLSITLLVAFGIFGRIPRPLAHLFLALYLVYLAATFWWMKPDEFDNLSEVFVAYEKENRERQLATEAEPQLLLGKLGRQLIGKQPGLASAWKAPFRAVLTLTVPSESNALMKTRLAPVVWMLSVATFMWSFGLAGNPALTFFLSYSVATIMLLLTRSTENAAAANAVDELLTLLSSIAWIKLICSVLMDAILLLSFLVGVNQLYLSIFIISVGNSLQDLFANISLSQMGYEQIAIISTFSGQLCNLLLGLWLSTITSGNRSFVLFDSGYQADAQDVGSALIFFFLACAILLIFLNSIYFTWNDFEYRKDYFWVGLGAYALFLAAAALHIWWDSPAPNR